MSKATCFVISPIGAAGTEINEEFQNVLDYLIRPALEIFDIEVVRGDHSTDLRIDDSVIRSVQEAELCICDISLPNPNVYYELGRRDETGKPILLLKNKESKSTPIDIATRRYVEYSLDFRTLREAQEQIRSFVQPLAEQGFAGRGRSASLADIADTLQRVERKLDRMQGGNSSRVSVPTQTATTQDPLSQWKLAQRQRNIPMAEEAMDQLQYRMDELAFYDQIVESTAAMGSKKAGAMMIDKAVEFMDSNLSFRKKVEFLGSLVSYLNRQDEELKNLQLVEELCDILEPLSHDEPDAFRIYNQKNRLYYGIYVTTGDLAWLDKAERELNRARELHEEGYIYYNLCMCVYKRYQANSDYSQLERARDLIERCLELEQGNKDDDDHLEMACKIYKDLGDPRLADMLDRLEVVNPYKAALLRE